jgi:hypothetical protein
MPGTSDRNMPSARIKTLDPADTTSLRVRYLSSRATITRFRLLRHAIPIFSCRLASSVAFTNVFIRLLDLLVLDCG